MSLDLEPELLWNHFIQLCKIPRCSKHEKQVAAHIVTVAENLGLNVKKDEVGNVLVNKPATNAAYANAPTVTIQSHLDMVCEKNRDVKHNFSTDPIDVYVDGDKVKARGTTLGADNGIGVATALALMEAEGIAHGPIEFLFTIDEETGMTGAFGLREGFVKGTMMINVDSEEYGSVYIGCAGGSNTTIHLPVSYEKGEQEGLEITIRNLKGGHSGTDIHEGRANSIQLITRFLYTVDARLSSIEAGNKFNAIPREAVATVVASNPQQIKDMAREFETAVRNEYSETDGEIIIDVSDSMVDKILDEQSHNRVVRMLMGLPHGVMAMNQIVQGLVETSTNLAIVRLSDELTVMMSTRSSIDSALDFMMQRIRAIGEVTGATIEEGGRYPGWKPDTKTELLDIAKRAYRALHDEDPEIKAIHAGLEPGVIGQVVHADMISIGPRIEHPHSPDEVVFVSSVQKFWNYMLVVLRVIGEQKS